MHFDAHLDTWQTYFGAPITHGTPFRRAAEEGLFTGGAQHARRHPRPGVRPPRPGRGRRARASASCPRWNWSATGSTACGQRIRERIGDAPLYLSIDIDVLDPAHAPGTGTPEAGGLTSRELLGILRGLAGLRLVGADVVEVAPAYDHAEMTAVAAAHVCYDLPGPAAARPELAPGPV